MILLLLLLNGRSGRRSDVVVQRGVPAPAQLRCSSLDPQWLAAALEGDRVQVVPEVLGGVQFTWPGGVRLEWIPVPGQVDWNDDPWRTGPLTRKKWQPATPRGCSPWSKGVAVGESKDSY